MEIGPFLKGEVASSNPAGAVQHRRQAYVPAPEPAARGGDDEVPGASKPPAVETMIPGAVEMDGDWLVDAATNGGPTCHQWPSRSTTVPLTPPAASIDPSDCRHTRWRPGSSIRFRCWRYLRTATTECLGRHPTVSIVEVAMLSRLVTRQGHRGLARRAPKLVGCPRRLPRPFR